MKKSLIPATILLVAIMFLFAEYTGEKEIIFPEIAALAFGAWVMKKSPWEGKWFHLWLSPTMAALTGIAIIKIFPYSPLYMISGAFILVIIQLKLTGSGVLPSISAAILPIIVHSNSFYYPLSVCILTAIIAFGKKIMEHCQKKCVTDSNLEDYHEKQKYWDTQEELIYWAKLLTGVVLVSAVALGAHCIYIVAPPLIVVFVELSKPKSSLQAKTGLILTLLVLAAILGVFWLYLIHYFLHWSVWISASLATLTVFLLFDLLKLPFPPAVAISLLPTVISAKSIGMYPWQVLLGSVAFIIISLVCFKKPQEISTANSQANYHNKS